MFAAGALFAWHCRKHIICRIFTPFIQQLMPSIGGLLFTILRVGITLDSQDNRPATLLFGSPYNDIIDHRALRALHSVKARHHYHVLKIHGGPEQYYRGCMAWYLGRQKRHHEHSKIYSSHRPRYMALIVMTFSKRNHHSRLSFQTPCVISKFNTRRL